MMVGSIFGKMAFGMVLNDGWQERQKLESAYQVLGLVFSSLHSLRTGTNSSTFVSTASSVHFK